MTLLLSKESLSGGSHYISATFSSKVLISMVIKMFVFASEKICAVESTFTLTERAMTDD